MGTGSGLLLHCQPKIGAIVAGQMAGQNSDRSVGVLVEDRGDDLAMFLVAYGITFFEVRKQRSVLHKSINKGVMQRDEYGISGHFGETAMELNVGVAEGSVVGIGAEQEQLRTCERESQ